MPRRPRVLHLLARRQGGGTETNIHRLCAGTPGFVLHALEDDLGFPFDWHLAPQLIRRIRRKRPDAVFCYGITAHLAACIAFPWGVPLVGNIRCESDFAGMKGLLRGMIDWRFSTWVSNSRRALGDIPGHVVYNGLPEPPEEVPMYRDLPKPVIGILARGHKKKGHRFFLNLWKKLGRPGTLIFAGDLQPDLMRAAMSQGVRCPGFVQSGPLLRSLDLLVIPSKAEGVPTVMLEAMVRGVPCLATPVGGVPEVVRHGENGYMLHRRDWAGFLRRIDWAEARRVGEAGRREVLERFTFNQMQQGFLRVVEEVLSR